MLQKPGSSSGRPRPQTSSRRKTQESPEDTLRQLQRLPPNKRCADCNSRLPQCVNLSIGSFVCISCAGIHRELNNRVKGIGHSTFTAEEVEQMKQTDNEKVNAVYLARYNPSQERMRMPQDNSNQQLLRAWPVSFSFLSVVLLSFRLVNAIKSPFSPSCKACSR